MGMYRENIGYAWFFTMLIEVYKDGYLPCSWMGEYPSGQVVVL